ncbi:tyrosine--tRNA ligase [Lipingzhangella sp. LS1_29]|uniref:Tyrosine--tRNA ligase n=1 Tax=Lipingzhangella rawalii TaxID=2055835 RepID=A0ABU2H7X6_9ACTN|nr:tyrosine--tRNA ligase [Lipingzhangella rawalii]MDS1271401.1 tyrosine--tRNA ligase [Lipingzhangella rawalii]
MTDIIDELEWRGLLAQTTDSEELRKTLADGPVTVYCGFDPTAGSLHVGHLTQILTLARFQRAGHRPLALVGGGTGLIGDPKATAERSLNDPQTVAGWVTVLARQLAVFLRFPEGNRPADPTDAILVDNGEWLAEISAIELLRDIGKHFSVNQMLARETVRSRLESSGMSYTEFSYVLLQSYDFLQLYRRYGCVLQTGGSDQWGNITAGIDLIRRVDGNEPHGAAHGVTTNLLTKADGTKFGKTESGTVWLDPELTSPYAFYQFWFNTDDQDISRYLRVFSFRSRSEIEELEQEVVQRPAQRAAQRALAEELTTLVHGSQECERVIAASRALFGQGKLTELDARTLGSALAEVPTTTVTVAENRDAGTDTSTDTDATASGLPSVVELLEATGLVSSRSAARRTVQEGGAYVNNAKVTDIGAVPRPADLLHGQYLVLRRGKRNVAGVIVT